MPLLNLASAPGADALAGLRAAVQPTPPLPLDDAFEAGLRPLVRRARRLLGADPGLPWPLGGLVGRATVRVSAQEVAATGLLHTRRVRWADATAVEVTPMTALAVQQLGAALTARLVPLPGVHEAVERVADPVVDRLAAWTTAIAGGAPVVVTAVRSRRRHDIELTGPLALVTLLSRALTDVLVAEAAARDVPVVPTTASP